MPKYRVIVQHTETVELDAGSFPQEFVEELLERLVNDRFDGGWGLVDVSRGTGWKSEVLSVEEINGKD